MYKLAELYYKVGNTERALFYVNKITEKDDMYAKAKSLKNQIVLTAQKAAAKNALSTTNSAIAQNRSIVDKFSGPTGLAVDSKESYMLQVTQTTAYTMLCLRAKPALYQKSIAWAVRLSCF